MADPFTPAFIAANCVWALIQNRADAAAVGGAKRLAGILRRQQSPANHDILAATHRAFVHSIQTMADACARSGGDAHDHFVARRLSEAARDPKLTTFNSDPRAIPKRELDANIRAIFEGSDGDPGRNATEAVIAGLEGAMGEPLTDTFRALFRDGSARHRSWPQAFALFFAEQVKTNERVFRALAFDRLNEIMALAETQTDGLTVLHQSVESFGRSLSDRLDTVGADVKEILLRLSGQERDAPIALLRSLAEAFGEARPEADAATLEAYLRDKIGEYHQLRQRIEAIQHEDNQDAALLADANLAIGKAEFDRADQYLREAEQLLDDRVDRMLIRKSERRGLRGDAARLKGDYQSAIAHYDAAVEMAPADAGELKALHAFVAAYSAQEWGETSNPAALADAVRRWRALSASTDPERADVFWSAIQNNLGVALRLVGERSPGTSLLTEAIAVFRAALEVRTRERRPIEWSETQNNLAAALRVLGERNGSLWVLTESVAAYRASLSILSRDQFPDEWARAMNNLGGALRVLGEVSRSTAALIEAAATFRLALEVRVRNKNPVDWAMTQGNLGTALGALGELKGDPTSLREAIVAFRSSMEVCTRDRLPIHWAMGQRNLGKALRSLGEREQGLGALEEADAAFVSALTVYSRDRFPLDWALTRGSQGMALHARAGRAMSYADARAAVAALEEARLIFSGANAPLYLASTERCLVEARAQRDLLRSRK